MSLTDCNCLLCLILIFKTKYKSFKKKQKKYKYFRYEIKDLLNLGNEAVTGKLAI
jgi:hypothetical protein